jgi:hypothetical protein
MGIIYHVLNRSVGRMQMFRKQSDFEAFERVMVEAHQRQPIRILSRESASSEDDPTAGRNGCGKQRRI